MADASRIVVHVDGRDLELSNLDKVLYPATGFTKGEVIHYYTQIADTIIPHLTDRALTRIRYPNGVGRQGFFEKNAPAGMPSWVRHETLPVPGSTMHRDTIDFVVVDGLACLVWLANLAALELHVPQWKVGSDGPDLLVVDLDPGAPAGLDQCAEVAVLLRERLAADGIDALPKTSGKKGMQLMAPISGTQSSDVVSAYAKRVAETDPVPDAWCGTSGQGVHRLEPERGGEDDRRAVLVAGRTRAHGLDAVHLGRGLLRRRHSVRVGRRVGPHRRARADAPAD